MTALSAIFFASGVAGLFYEIVFAKSLALIFGSTSDATTTVLATYMGGLALGAWIGGWLSGRVRNLLRAYALCELAIGVICAASPLTLHAVRSLYVAAAGSIDPGAAVLLVLRVALGGLALLPPTLLMGMTLPLLLQRLSPDARSIGRGVGLLYGANTLGASLGALAAASRCCPAARRAHHHRRRGAELRGGAGGAAAESALDGAADPPAAAVGDAAGDRLWCWAWAARSASRSRSRARTSSPWWRATAPRPSRSCCSVFSSGWASAPRSPAGAPGR